MEKNKKDKIIKIDDLVKDKQNISIFTHINPDGDAIGSTIALYTYLIENFSFKNINVYLNNYDVSFKCLKYIKDSKKFLDKESLHSDISFFLDVSTIDRIGVSNMCFKESNLTVCIDHHICLDKFADIDIIEESSSTCENLYHLLDKNKISSEVAKALFIGIIHDTGLFQYNVSDKTKNIIFDILKYDCDFSKIIRYTFFEKSYEHQMILSNIISNSIIYNHNCMICFLNLSILKKYNVKKVNTGSMANVLINIRDIEIMILLNEIGKNKYKVSFRSKSYANVFKIAQKYNGGGHKMASGAIIYGKIYDIISMLKKDVDEIL